MSNDVFYYIYIRIKGQTFNQNQKKPNKMSNQTNITLTEKEKNLLIEIKDSQNEYGHSDFLGDDCQTKSRAGIISSLLKKELIFDSYAKVDPSMQMYVLKLKAVEIVGVPSGWEYSGDWEHHLKHGDWIS